MRWTLPLLLLLLPFTARAGERKVDPVRIPAVVDLNNKLCPVTGKPVRPEFKTDWNGVRIRFCCPGCDAKFRKAPAKYAAKLGIKLVQQPGGKTLVDLANARCPVMGGPAKDAVHGDFAGVRMHYCCPGCDAKARANPAKAIATAGATYIPSVIDLRNTRCPMTGEAIPAGDAPHVDHDGIRIRLCCADCAAGVRRNPAAALKKLGVDPARLKAEVK